MKYREQFDRMMRWYQRFKRIDQGIVHRVESPNYEDEVHAFFMSCYHLKDWIKNDDSSDLKPTSRESVETFVNENFPLRICADVCNGLKHLVLDRERSGVSPTLGPQDYSLELGKGSPIVSIKFRLETSKGTMDLFTLAADCVEKWKKFIEDSRIP